MQRTVFPQILNCLVINMLNFSGKLKRLILVTIGEWLVYVFLTSFTK